MNPQIQAEEQLVMATNAETRVSDREALAQAGVSPEEIVALLWLRQWYQTGDSDRVPLMRHWKFLKQLLMSSKLEV